MGGDRWMTSFIKWTIGLVAVAIAIGSAYYLWIVREIPVRVAVPQENVQVRIFGIGTVEAQVLSKVGFQVAGKLASLHADQGDFVAAGTVLARLDDAAQRAKLLKSEATRRQAAANLIKVRAQRDRVAAAYQQKRNVNLRRQTLADRGTVSQEAAEDAQAAEAIAYSDLKVVEADAAIASVLEEDAAAQHKLDAVVLAQHELTAPFDARIIARHKEIGSVANAGEPAFTLIAPQSIWVRAYVDEALAAGLSVGQTAFVRLRSESNRLVETEVVRIDQESDRITEERRVYVRCRVCDPKHQLRFIGEQAEVEVVKWVIPRGLFVPLKLVEGYDGHSGTLWLLREGRLAKQRVELGDRLLDGRIQVISELPPAVSIVIDEQAALREGRAALAITAGRP
jgi:HlyD family secretion protein